MRETRILDTTMYQCKPVIKKVRLITFKAGRNGQERQVSNGMQRGPCRCERYGGILFTLPFLNSDITSHITAELQALALGSLARILLVLLAGRHRIPSNKQVFGKAEIQNMFKLLSLSLIS